VASCELAVALRLLFASEWHILRDVRLDALAESPTSFLSSFEAEERHSDEWWRDEVRRGSWMVWTGADDVAEAVLGATPASDPTHRYLSSVWVAPHVRRVGVGTLLIRSMLSYLSTHGVTRVCLWVLDGNDAACALYRKLGFETTGIRKLVLGDPFRWEEQFTLGLT
jgi:ribosomal protein S18 acetylase RimI-like enzyme